jgi:hypothetical protein
MLCLVVPVLVGALCIAARRAKDADVKGAGRERPRIGDGFLMPFSGDANNVQARRLWDGRHG